MAGIRKIKKVLIANRGEIAFRISKTLKKMKIESVGVCISAEKNASFLSLCSEIHVFARNELTSYLDIDQIILIAKKSKVDAIHPGYGFLSENPQFAKACETNGIIFIGPNSTTIELMGNKNKAKEFAKKCNIPVLETVVEAKENDPSFVANLSKLKFPVMLKPLSGGGGKGMVILDSPNNVEEHLNQARSIALKSFGDSRLLAEPLILHALHIEVQVIGDAHGNIRHLFERDCTIQRRHQKIIEETPSHIVSKEKLMLMYDAAISLAKQSKYKSLGTVEFILDRDQHFYFMEMNTRLQVEHPVTEITLGLDLVEKQIKIAEGTELSKILPQKLTPKGHAIEVRIYTENPTQNFLPSTGKIEYLSLPKETKSLRIDCGIEKGTRIHHAFDPMIMKLTAHGKNRAQTIETLLYALQKTTIFGVHTNIDYLQWILQHSDFIEAGHFTTWTGITLEQFKELEVKTSDLEFIIQSYQREKMRKESDWRNDPWLTIGQPEAIVWRNESFSIRTNESTTDGKVVETADTYWVTIYGCTYTVPKIEKNFDPEEQLSSNVVRAPMTGTVVQVHFQKGQKVKKHDVLVEMEAMKMQYKIESPMDGIISEINYQPKDIAEHDSVLVVLQ